VRRCLGDAVGWGAWDVNVTLKWGEWWFKPLKNAGLTMFNHQTYGNQDGCTMKNAGVNMV